jgi:hypothetical protein
MSNFETSTFNNNASNRFKDLKDEVVSSADFAIQIFGEVDELCSIEDPENTPFKSKYLANDTLVICKFYSSLKIVSTLLLSVNMH